MAGTGSRPWAPGVVRLGQARGKRKGDRARGGPGSREFPSSTTSPIRYPVGPRKCGLACSQAELVTHPSLPTLDHGTAGQLAEGWGHVSPRGTLGLLGREATQTSQF